MRRSPRRRLWYGMLLAGLVVGCATSVPKDVLHVGPGPEDIAIVTWPDDPSGQPVQVAVTSLASRRRSDPSDAPTGFRFVGLSGGRPVVLDDGPQLPGGTTGPWQGLYWQEHCALAQGRGVLAATRTAHWRKRPFWFDRFEYAGGAVDLFVLAADRSGTTRTPTLVPLEIEVPELCDGRPPSFNFNSVALAPDGTLYASVMSLARSGTAQVVPTPADTHPCEKIVKGSIYMWRPQWPSWRLAASGIPGANGLALVEREDGEKLFVSAAGSARVIEFDRDPVTGALRPDYVVHALPKGSAPDNLKVEPDGRVVVTATPSGTWTGLYLWVEQCLGVGLGSPRGEVWAVGPSGGEPTKLFSWPDAFVCPSTTIHLGDWWLGSQTMGDGIAYRPVQAP